MPAPLAIETKHDIGQTPNAYCAYHNLGISYTILPQPTPSGRQYVRRTAAGAVALVDDLSSPSITVDVRIVGS